jgi:hypothetical protein
MPYLVVLTYVIVTIITYIFALRRGQEQGFKMGFGKGLIVGGEALMKVLKANKLLKELGDEESYQAEVQISVDQDGNNPKIDVVGEDNVEQ